MSTCRGRANEKLYHAAILMRMLSAELAREELPARVVLEAAGLAVRQHLLDAYGWFLLELAGVSDFPAQPPHSVDSLQASYGLAEPLRGELVELRVAEREGWLGQLQAVPGGRPAVTGGGNLLPVAEQSWSEEQLRGWHDLLADLIDRLGHGLDEW